MDYVVSAVMKTEIESVIPTTNLEELQAAFLKHGVGGFPVVEGGAIIGVVSQADALATTTQSASDALVRDIMTTDVILAKPNDHLHDVADQMYKNKIHRIFVVDDGKLVGVVTPFDFVRLYSNDRIGADGRPPKTKDF